MVIGAAGQIGSELTSELRLRYGSENVIGADIRLPPSPELEEGPFIRLDVTKREDLKRALSTHGIDTIYHLAAILSAKGERDPVFTWEVNLGGLWNVLEAARRNGVERVFWPSSIAVFGPRTPKEATPQETVLDPTTIYGVTKVAGEHLCAYYRKRYGLDIRGVRYPGIISSRTLPGGGTTDYAVEMFHAALRGEEYTCFVEEDTVLPMMYIVDAIEAAIRLMEAPAERLRYPVNYNVAAMSFSAGELAEEIRKHIPGFRCRFVPDYRQEIAATWPRTIDDVPAREDWGWAPRYDLRSMVEEMIRVLRKRLLENEER